jgi:hypothetical protein
MMTDAQRDTLIQETVQKFINDEEMFTSVDIANAIKKEGIWVRNTEVRDWLRNNYDFDDLFENYESDRIPVCNGTRYATVYLPAYRNADEYEPTNQKALTPSEVEKIRRDKEGSSDDSDDQTPAKANSKYKDMDVADLLDDTELERVIYSHERIKIPGVMIRKMGYKPGDSVDASVIKTHSPIPKRLKVNKDYRLSIPRDCVKWGVSPVKVKLKENKEIVFEKA